MVRRLASPCGRGLNSAVIAGIMVTTTNRHEFRIRLQKRARLRLEKRLETIREDLNWHTVRIRFTASQLCWSARPMKHHRLSLVLSARIVVASVGHLIRRFSLSICWRLLSVASHSIQNCADDIRLLYTSNTTCQLATHSDCALWSGVAAPHIRNMLPCLISRTWMLITNSLSRALRFDSLCNAKPTRRLWELSLSGTKMLVLIWFVIMTSQTGRAYMGTDLYIQCTVSLM